MQVKKILSTLLVILIMAALLPMQTLAAGTGFSVEANIPSNQYGNASSYFDLMMQPGQVQDISVTVTNDSDEPIVVSVGAYTASTNRNGIVDYSDPVGIMDDSLKYSFADLANVQEETLDIPVGGSHDVMITLTMPEEGFDGILLGSIQVLKELTEEEIASGGMILNQFRYGVAVQLRTNENPVEVDFAMGDVTATLVNYRASIVANIHNTQPVGAGKASLIAQVYPIGSDTAIFEAVKDEVDFAPNAVFPFTFTDEAGYGIEAGDYSVHVTLNYKDRTWEFDQEFNIAPEEAAEMNRNALNQTQQAGATAGAIGGFPVWLIIVIAVAVVLVIVVILLVISMMKRNKQIEMMYQNMNLPSPNELNPPTQNSKKDDGDGQSK